MSTVRAEPVEGARLRRPRWRDPRLLVGLVLVLASLAGVVALVTSAQRTSTYWAAAEDIAPGAPVEAAAFVPVEANLTAAEGLYLPATAPAPDGKVAAAALRKGELVPARSLGDADPQQRRSVGLELGEPLPEGIDPGDRVDVWVAAPKEGGRGFADPQRIAAGLEIAELTLDESGLGGGATTRVQLMVAEDVLPRLLHAKVTDARITVVPALGAG